MPKDEFDFEDPMELNGIGIVSSEDTTEAMTECFVEEFMRLGHNHKQILALFRNPHYIGMNMALQNRGEPFVREVITELFARWGRVITWPEPNLELREKPPLETEDPKSAAATGSESGLTDPMGSPIPDVTV